MVTPYLVFNGTCAEALAFYSHAFGSQVSMQQPYGGYIPEGSAVEPEVLKEWILHAEMEIAGAAFWFADEVKPVTSGDTVRLTITVPAKHTAQQVFDCLAAGGTVTLPPTETFYSTFHASVTDKYGICWNIVAEEAPEKPAT